MKANTYVDCHVSTLKNALFEKRQKFKCYK